MVERFKVFVVKALMAGAHAIHRLVIAYYATFVMQR